MPNNQRHSESNSVDLNILNDNHFVLKNNGNPRIDNINIPERLNPPNPIRDNNNNIPEWFRQSSLQMHRNYISEALQEFGLERINVRAQEFAPHFNFEHDSVFSPYSRPSNLPRSRPRPGPLSPRRGR